MLVLRTLLMLAPRPLLLLLLAAQSASALFVKDLQQCSASVKLLNHTGLGTSGIVRTVASASWSACCALCTADAQCTSWTWHTAYGTEPGNTCGIRHGVVPPPRHNKPSTVKVSGIMPRPAPPAPSPGPSPAPVPAGSQKNIIFVINDDQVRSVN